MKQGLNFKHLTTVLCYMSSTTILTHYLTFILYQANSNFLLNYLQNNKALYMISFTYT